MTRPLVIGVGNRLRRDDGAGPAVLDVLHRLAGQGTQPFETIELAGDCARLIDLWDGRAVVSVVDATRSGRPAGAITRFDALDRPLPRDTFLHTSHVFGVTEAVETARLVDRLPGRLTVWGIEGRDFGQGEGLTPQVTRAAARVGEAILIARATTGGDRTDGG